MTSSYFRPNSAGRALIAAGKRLRREAPEYGTWWLRYRDESGRMVRERSTARMQTEAERLVHEKAIFAERVKSGVEKRMVTPIPCDELLRRYEAASQHQSSLGPMRSQIRLWIAPHFGKKLVNRVTPADCEALLQKSRDAGQAPATTRMLHIRSRLVFEYARRKLGLIAENPWNAVDRPTLERRAVTVLQPEQIATLLGAAGPWRILLVVALLTGLRRGELGALKWSDIDWDAGEHGVIHVRRSWSRSTTKGSKERLVPVHPQLRPELDAYRQRVGGGDGLVFPAPRKGGMRHTSWHVTKLLRSIASRAGVTLPAGFTFHGLRKQFGSFVHQATGDLVATQRLLGHASPQVTAAIYLADDVAHLARQVGRFRVVSGMADEHTASTRTSHGAVRGGSTFKKEQQMQALTSQIVRGAGPGPSSSCR
ncbi:site-specific integrase, partial [Corallococcus sp. CA054B]